MKMSDERGLKKMYNYCSDNRYVHKEKTQVYMAIRNLSSNIITELRKQ